VITPAYANAYRETTLAVKRASVRLWTAFRPHRDVSTSLGISAAIHLILLFGIGTALYIDGADDTDVPELSVQLVTREGPNDEEFTEASLPQPVPDPVEDVLDDPGTGELILDAPTLADATPMIEQVPDVAQTDTSAAIVDLTPTAGAVLTTTGVSTAIVAAVAEADSASDGAVETMPQPEPGRRGARACGGHPRARTPWPRPR
jgi:hypothetical protein